MSIEAARTASSQQLSKSPEWQKKMSLASSDDDLMAIFFAFCESVGADVSREDVQNFFAEMKSAVIAGTGPGDELSDQELEAVAGGKKKKKDDGPKGPINTATEDDKSTATINSTNNTTGWWCVCCGETKGIICSDTELL